MSFAQDSIGFYLQLEDEMSPKLKVAESNYTKFVRSMEKLNEQSFKSMSNGMGAISDLVDSFAKLPKQAEQAYKKATVALTKRIKPIVQRVDLLFTPRGERNLRRAIGSAIADVMSKVSIRLGATVPLKREKGFRTDRSLRAMYMEMTQPPDMKGVYQGIPRFAEGGEVTQGKGKGIDDVLALLSKGEIVLPVEMADKLKQLAAASLDAEGVMGKQEAFEAMTEAVAALAVELGKIGTRNGAKAARAMRQVRDETGKFQKTVDKTSDALEDMLDDKLSTVKLLTINEALESLSGAFGGFQSQAEQAFEVAGGGRGRVDDFMDSLNNANLVLGKSRDELAILKEDLADLSKGFQNVGADQFAQAFNAIVQSGAGEEFAKQNAGLVAQLAQVGVELEQATMLTYKLQDGFGFSQEGVTGLIENLRIMAKDSAIPFETLLQAQQDNMESLGAFLDQMDSVEDRQKLMQGLAAATASLTKNWGAAGGELSKLFSDALADPSSEAAKQLTNMVGDMTSMREAAMRGDVSGAMEDLVTRVQALGSNTPMLTKLGEMLGFPGTPAELSKVIKSGDDMLAWQDKLLASTLANDKAQDSFVTRLEGSESQFQAFSKQVGKFVLGMIPSEVLDFFDGFSVQAAVATAILAKMGLGFVAGGVKMLGFSKIGGKVTDAVSGMSGLGGGKSGKGGVLSGIAQGFAAFAHPKVALGMGALVLAIAGLAVAARIAQPVLEKFFVMVQAIAFKAIDAFVMIFDKMKELEPKKILALSVGLLSLGPALAFFGTGLLAFSYSALLAVPGLLGLNAALDAMGGEGGAGAGAGSMAATIEAMMDAFAIDPAIANKALKGIGAAAMFMAGFTGVMLLYNIAKVGAIGSRLADDWQEMWGAPSLTDIFVKEAKKIAEVVDGIAKHYGDIGPSMQAKIEAAGPVMSAMASFMKDYATASLALTALKGGALLDNVSEWTLQVFFKKTGAVAIVDQAQEIIRVANMLGTEFAPGKVDTDALLAAVPTFSSIAEFIGHYASLADAYRDLDVGLMQRFGEAFLQIIGGDSPMQAIAKEVQGIQNTVRDITNGFMLIEQDLDDKMIESAKKGIVRAMGMLDAFKPVIENMTSLQSLSESLQGDWVDDLLAIFGVDSPMERLRAVLIGEPGSNGENSIIGMISEIGTFLAETTTGWQGLGGLWDKVLPQINRLALLGRGLGDASTGFRELYAASQEFLAGKDYTAKLVDIKVFLNSLARIPGMMKDAKDAADASKLEFYSDYLGAPEPPSKTDIEKVVRVELDPNTTDRPLLNETMETNILLARILDAVSSQGPRMVADRASPRQADPRTKVLSRGGD